MRLTRIGLIIYSIYDKLSLITLVDNLINKHMPIGIYIIYTI